MALALAGALILSLTAAGLAQAVNSDQSVAVTLAHSKAGTAEVGGGKAAGLALGQREDLTVTAYDGPGGKAVILHVTGTKPLKIDSVIVGKLVPDSGAFGRKLVVAIPANLQQPLGGVYATLTSFMTKVGGSSKGTPYVALKGCSGGKLKFKGDFVFTDGSKQSPTSTSSCTK